MSWTPRAASQAPGLSAQPDSSPLPEPPQHSALMPSQEAGKVDNARGTEEPHPQSSPGSGLSWGPSPRSTSGGEEETPEGTVLRAGGALTPHQSAGPQLVLGEQGIQAPQERMADCLCLGPRGLSLFNLGPIPAACHQPTFNRCDVGPNPV